MLKPASRLELPALACLVAGYLLVFVHLAGIASFSPDSWSFFELARTFGAEEFYRPNTQRSFFSYDRSASFPFGYPAALAAVNSLLGWEPVHAAYLNAALALCAFFLARSLAMRLGLSGLAGSALAVGLVFLPGFLDEVVAGRSVPAATTVLLAGARVLLGARSPWRLLAGGALLGASAVIRFDFLLSAWAAMLLVLWLDERRPRRILLAHVGFVLGTLPWVVFSWVTFSSFWASDNSWVALSAEPAFVRDFPARAERSLFSDPLGWLARIAPNGVRVLLALGRSLQEAPLLLFLGVYAVVLRGRRELVVRSAEVWVAGLGLAVMLAPYALTGYTDPRYFAVPLLVAAIALLLLVTRDRERAPPPLIYRAAIAVTLAMAAVPLAVVACDRDENQVRLRDEQQAIARFERCQRAEPGRTYVFAGEARRILFRYGAETGNPTASLPSNFESLEPATRDAFFESIAPYRLFDSLDADACATARSPEPE